MGKRNQSAVQRAAVHKLAGDRTARKRLWEGLTRYFFSLVLLLFTFFLLGNYQQFLDRTQFLIMNLLLIAVFLHLTAALYFLFSSMATGERPIFPTRRKRILFVAGVTFSFLLFLVLQFFNVWLVF